MSYTFRRACLMVLALGLILSCGRTALGDAARDAPLVNVSFSSGETEIDDLKLGVNYFTDRDFTVDILCPAVSGQDLKFTRRPVRSTAEVTIDAAAGSTVYLITSSDDKGTFVKDPGLVHLRKTLKDSGWARAPKESHFSSGDEHWLTVYKRSFHDATRLAIPSGGGDGIAIASANLALVDAPATDNGPPSPSDQNSDNPDNVSVRPAANAAPIAGQTVHIANPQATIKILAVIGGSDDPIGGEALDFILTVTPGTSSKMITARFVTPIGDETAGVADDVFRFIHIKYPNWYADKAEFTFGDRSAVDGPSIGAAIGTLVRSAIEGFQIDPDAAITGDIAANGHIHAIGGLSYKLHGAADAGCTIVAVPMENYDNLADAVIYKGPQIVTDVQVIGMSDLDDAVAILRSDRDPKLAQAITIFSMVQQSLRDDPHALTNNPTLRSELIEVLSLAPNHLSAKVLLTVAEKRLPRTLSPTASLYYTGIAASVMGPILNERDNFDPKHQISSALLQQQLAELDKLRLIADPKIVPFIDACTRFIRARVALQSGYGSADTVVALYQKVIDAATIIYADPDLSQKMLNEGM